MRFFPDLIFIELLHLVCRRSPCLFCGVDIPLQGKCRCAVAEVCLHRFQVYTVHQCKRCVRVPQIMYTGIRQANAFGNAFEVCPQGMRIDTAAQCIGKAEAPFIAPCRPGGNSGKRLAVLFF